jgi:hypothetical protein
MWVLRCSLSTIALLPCATMQKARYDVLWPGGVGAAARTIATLTVRWRRRGHRNVLR